MDNEYPKRVLHFLKWFLFIYLMFDFILTATKIWYIIFFFLNSFELMESFCLFKVGFKSLMNSVSNIRQSHLVLHFLKILKSLESCNCHCHASACARRCQSCPRVRRLFVVGVGLYSRHNQPRTGHIAEKTERSK